VPASALEAGYPASPAVNTQFLGDFRPSAAVAPAGAPSFLWPWLTRPSPPSVPNFVDLTAPTGIRRRMIAIGVPNQTGQRHLVS